MPLNPVHVRSLEEVARSGSFSRAAETLRLSQPAVSHHIRHLETAIGTRLLDRVGKRAHLTRAGAVVLDHATRAFRELELAHDAVRRLDGVMTGRVRIGCGATAATYLLPRVLGRLRRRHPALELVVVTGNTTDVAAAVEARDIDVALVTLPVRGRRLSVREVVREEIVALATPGRRQPRAITPAALAGIPLILFERGGTIREVLDGWFRRGGVVPRVSMELGSVEAIKKLVAAGLGVSLLPAVSVAAEARAGALVVRRLSPRLHRRLGIAQRPDAAGPVVATVVAALEHAVARPRTPR